MTSAPQSFGRYELLGILGGGGFATVYRGRDPVLNRDVALKALLPHLAADAIVRQRFLAEARAIAGLHHPNIVTIYDVGEADGRPFFAMELIEGQTLGALISSGPPMQPQRVLEMMRGLCGAVDALHAAGLIHRDIKPANVMVDQAGQVVLMDFGIARSQDGSSFTQAGDSIGTPRYMAPEQVRGEVVGPATDIYALGILAYELLAGRPPFTGATAAVLHAQVYDAPPPLAELRPGLSEASYAAINMALAKAAADRPATAGAFAEALSGALGEAGGFVAAPGGWSGAAGAGGTARADEPTQLAGRGSITPQFVPATPTSPTSTFTPQFVPASPSRALQTPPAPGGRGRRTALIVAGAVLAALVIGSAGVFGATKLFGGSGKGSPTPAVAASSASATVTPTGGAAGLATATALHVYDNERDKREGTFDAGNSVVACMNLKPGALATPLTVVVTATGSAPHDANESGVVARSGDVQPASGQVCVPVPSLRGRFAAGPYWLWVLQGQSVIATVTFRAAAATATPSTVPPTPTPVRTASPVATPRPTATRAAAPPAPPDLSLPAEARANVPLRPALKITSVTATAPAQAGGAFQFEVVAKNVGGAGGAGSLTVSSPEAVSLAAESGACELTRDTASLAPGTTVSTFGGGTRATVGRVSSRYWIAEETFPQGWGANAQCTLIVRASAPASGSLTFYLRATSSGPAGEIVSWPYGTGSDVADDQQGFKAIRWVVPVEPR